MAAKWSQLKKVESYSVVKSMYVWLLIVPIAAKATAKIRGIVDLEIFGHDFTFDFGLPFSWEAFYFAALAFVIGNIAVIARCPKIVLENTDYASFKMQGKGRTHLFEYWKDIGKTAEDFGTVWGNTDHVNMDYLEKAIEDQKSGTFWDGFKNAETVRAISRYFCSFFYFVGFILIAIVLLQNLGFVIQFLIEAKGQGIGANV